MDPVFCREAIERQQYFRVLGQAGHTFLKIDAVFFFEQIECDQGFGARFSMLDVVQIRFHRCRHRLGKIVQNVLHLMNPATLMFGAGENLIQGFPKAHGTVTNRNLRRSGQTAAFDIRPPNLGPVEGRSFTGHISRSS